MAGHSRVQSSLRLAVRIQASRLLVSAFHEQRALGLEDSMHRKDREHLNKAVGLADVPSCAPSLAWVGSFAAIFALF
jgi:hypothetical protein